MPPVPKPKRTKRTFKRPAGVESVPMEITEQQTVIDWLTAKRILHTAIVPDRKICKRMGYSPGVPDIIIFDRPPICVNGQLYIGAAIEMKRRKYSDTSDNQIKWHNDLRERGWAVKVAYGCDDAIAFLESLEYGR